MRAYIMFTCCVLHLAGCDRPPSVPHGHLHSCAPGSGVLRYLLPQQSWPEERTPLTLSKGKEDMAQY